VEAARVLVDESFTPVSDTANVVFAASHPCLSGLAIKGLATSAAIHFGGFWLLVVANGLWYQSAQIAGRTGPMSLAAIASAPADGEFGDDGELLRAITIKTDTEPRPGILISAPILGEIHIEEPESLLFTPAKPTKSGLMIELTAAEVLQATPAADKSAALVQKPGREKKPIEENTEKGSGTKASSSPPRADKPPDQEIEPGKKIMAKGNGSVASSPSPASEGNQFDVQPRFNDNAPIPYPREAIDAKFDGSILLRLRIETDGHVSDVQVVRSTGHAILDEAAVKTVKTWRGEPARFVGRAVAATVLLPVRFQLR
jgi:periplasmic protein TonB